MPDDLKTYACWVGRPVLASQSNRTIVGVYAGFNSLTGKGLMPSPNDNATQFGCYGATSGATSNSHGSANTNAIIAAKCGETAAAMCLWMGADYYLPSRDELQILYNNRAAIGGLSPGEHWSSTEYDNTYAWSLNFSNGSWVTSTKNGNRYVRCVRSF
jgi:hypothetical protein